MLGSQVSSATLHRTASPTAAKGTATVANRRKCGDSQGFQGGLQRFEQSQIFFLKVTKIYFDMP